MLVVTGCSAVVMAPSSAVWSPVRDAWQAVPTKSIFLAARTKQLLGRHKQLLRSRGQTQVKIGLVRPFGHQYGIVSSAKGLDSGRRSHRVEPLWRPISDKLEFRYRPNVRLLSLIGLFWCPTRWPRWPESRPFAELTITGIHQSGGVGR